MTEKEWRQTLSQRRRTARLTQQKLADLAGVSVGTISAIERGAGRPSRRVMESIEFALLSSAYRRKVGKTFDRLCADDIARIFDRATVMPVDMDGVMAYVVSPA